MSDVVVYVEHLGARPAVCVVNTVLEAGCPGRTGARRPPCATSPGKTRVQRSARRVQSATACSFTSRMLILAADFRGKRERRAHAEPPMISGRWPTVSRQAAASAHAPRTLHNKQ